MADCGGRTSFVVFIFMVLVCESNLSIGSKREIVLKEDPLCPVHDHTLLSRIMHTVSWKSVAIIHSNEDDFDLQRIFDVLDEMALGIQMWTYDVSDKSRDYMKSLLLTSYRKDVDGFLLILNEQTVQFLELANVLDYESNRTTNFRTNSKWIIFDHFNFNNFEQPFDLKHAILLQCGKETLEASTVMDGQHTETVSCLQNNFECSLDELFPNVKYKFNGRHLLIGTNYIDQFISKSYDQNNNTVYMGILADMIAIIAHQLNFTYTLIETPDQRYGSIINGTWNGLTGQLLYQQVDMVVADFTISSERLEVIDFILPTYLSQKLGIIYRNDIAEESNWIKLFRPLSSYVYICFLATVLGVGILLYLIDVDFDHNSSFYATKKRTLLKFFSSLMSVLGFVSLNGNGLWPKKTSARILVAHVWLFTVVLTATYVGNLTAKLTERIEARPFSSLDELVNLDDWKWGMMGGGLVESIIKNSREGVMEKLYARLLEFNKTDPDTFQWELDIQLEKVLNSGKKYALVLLDPKFYMFKSTHCNFAIVDNVISSLSLALAVTKNSYLKHDLEKTMWALSSNGILQLLQDQFYVDQRPTSCKVSQTNRPMCVDDMLGLVLVFGFGIGLSAVILVVEILLNEFHRKNQRTYLTGKE